MKTVDLSKFKVQPEWKDFPPIVFLDNTTQCNMRCIHCINNDPPQWYLDKIAKEPKFMPITLALDVIDEVADSGNVIRLCSDGEPLVHPEIERIIKYIFERNVKVLAVTTNGYFLDRLLRSLPANLFEMKISVEVSLDALYRDTYNKIRLTQSAPLQNKSYYVILRNVFAYLRERNDNMKLMVSAIDQPELPREELAEFTKFWGKIADRVIIRPYVDMRGILNPKTMKRDENVERWPCTEPFTRTYVCPNGDIRFCADDYRRDTIIGHLDYRGDKRRESITSIWSGPQYEKLRQDHISGNLSDWPCETCMEWQSKDWSNNYIQAMSALFQGDIKKE